jgi:hypothetical protein
MLHNRRKAHARYEQRRSSRNGRPSREAGSDRGTKGGSMNRTRPCWTKIAEQLIHVAAAVIQALKRLGLPPPRSAAT